MKPHEYSRTLTDLESDDWGEPNYLSHLVVETHRLRKVPIIDFTAEDFRIMIGQQISLEILMPKAIEMLAQDPLVSGDFYSGDLLLAVLSKGGEFLRLNEYWKNKVLNIVEEHQVQIAEESRWLSKQVTEAVNALKACDS